MVESLLEAADSTGRCKNSNYWQQLLHNSRWLYRDSKSLIQLQSSQTSAGTGFSESGAMSALPIVGFLPVRISPQYKNLAQK
jgi:hypothetical protein